MWSMILQQCMNRIAQWVSMMWLLCYNLKPRKKMKTEFQKKVLSQQLENYNVKLNWLKLSMLKESRGGGFKKMAM
jgi:hypothetical protein